ncbi:serine/threonine-protein kinase [Streptomyces sp. NBC_01304]|uniref:serine/threonine-protein kinase n=1 Tax=Streptomyces sp. NBC_01304 TaxID=2903818 RepID=UPI002E0ED85E|nr:serine/threonine protein kinase [Streptomyces sp. NBC_01304]
MGTVWRARDEVLKREVAVKEVRAPAGLPRPDVERLYARLEREAWAAARVSHRSVVTVYDVATEGDRPWIVMELVRGLSLSEVLDAEGTLTPQRTAHIGAEVLAALRSAHDVGVLHRDVKPGNVLLSNDGRIVLTDFGIAMVEGSSALTMTGEVVGSPEFLAPERALGRTPGPESDLWSLGVLLYAAVEGYSPFRQDTPLSTLRAVVDEELPPPRRAGPLAPVIAGLLRKDPAERMSAEQAERDLRLVGAGGTPRADTAQAAAYLPTAAAERPTPPTPIPATAPSPSFGPATTTQTTTARPRRAAFALIAGLAALALALGGLTYALVNRDDGGGSGGGSNGGSGNGGSDSGGSGGSNGSSDSPSGADDGGSQSTGDNGGGDDGGKNGGNGGATTPPPQSVKVTVSGASTDYTGTCPPTEYPAFTASITVGRVPVAVEYRWVTAHGEPSDPDWKALDFAEGGGKTQEVNHTEAGYEANGTVENEMGVEVRKPLAATSNSVAYTVVCEEEPPTDGGSYTPDVEAQAVLTRRR